MRGCRDELAGARAVCRCPQNPALLHTCNITPASRDSMGITIGSSIQIGLVTQPSPPPPATPPSPPPRSMGIAIGSSIQIGLLAIPLVTVVGWATGHAFSLAFDPFSALVLVLSVVRGGAETPAGGLVGDGGGGMLRGWGRRAHVLCRGGGRDCTSLMAAPRRAPTMHQAARPAPRPFSPTPCPVRCRP